MSEIFKLYLSLSVSGTVLMGVIFLLKKFIRNRFSQTWQYYIWVLVIFKLMIPIIPYKNAINESIELVKIQVDVADFTKTQADTTKSTEAQEDRTKFTETQPDTTKLPEMQPNMVKTADAQPDEARSVDVQQDETKPVDVQPKLQIPYMDVAAILWIAVAVLLFSFRVIKYLRFRNHLLQKCLPLSYGDFENLIELAAKQKKIKRLPKVYVCDEIDSPIAMGLFHKCILFPQTTRTKQEYYLIILHELTHYKRKDSLYSWMLQLTLSVHWFNPFVYLLKKEINHSCELSCDETVIRKMDFETLRAYGDTLINTAQYIVNRSDKMNALAFRDNKGLLKDRLLFIMNYKKQKGLAIVVMLCLTVAMGVSGYFLGGYVFYEDEAGAKTNLTDLANMADLADIADAADALDGADALNSLDTLNSLDAHDVTKGDQNQTALEGETDYNCYNLKASDYQFTNGDISIHKSFCWDNYAYELIFTQDSSYQIGANNVLTLADGHQITVYEGQTDALNVSGMEDELTGLLSKIRTEAGKDLRDDMICEIENYRKLDADFDTLAQKAYNDDEVWIFQAIFPQLSIEEKNGYIEKAYQDSRIEYFCKALDLTSGVDKDTYLEKAYQDDRVDIFSVLMENMSDIEREDYKTRARDDGKVAFTAILINKGFQTAPGESVVGMAGR